MFVRSYLFVPGDRPERFDKAVSSGADTVILDLEDGVSPEHKSIARDAIREWLARGGKACIRINGVDTEWYEEDCRLLNMASILAALLPKAEAVFELSDFVNRVPAGMPVIPLIESALGLWKVFELAQVPGVTRLAFGSVDFQLDTGIEDEENGLLYARSRIVLASAAARLESPVDGVTVAIDDLERLARDVSFARKLGFGAKLCIHPRQVAVVNEGFSPSDEDLQWARLVVDAAARSGGFGAIRLNGKLIDRPVIERAKRMLEGSR
ncbi:HpcH/HpaI aldolase/citrate lyase family protein [Tepidiphilus baoligensis]|uniref:CoA ester lyase n=1 Tax=Tepidiphilus baoligensis TaxID=2698687 RepID=A0ABX1QMK7_9PROT|nr:CoA ester lyase [Tepidiphilus baoligensis]NMH16932.1 CoA ester lyase [Tepidiphilus baoligensis]